MGFGVWGLGSARASVGVHPTSTLIELFSEQWRQSFPRRALPTLSTGVVFIMNTIPPQGIGAVCIMSEEKAPIPYGKSYL